MNMVMTHGNVMATKIIEPFYGYTSKPGDYHQNEPGLASTAEDVVINKGDLCNLPLNGLAYAYDNVNLKNNTEKLMAWYYTTRAPYIFIYDSTTGDWMFSYTGPYSGVAGNTLTQIGAAGISVGLHNLFNRFDPNYASAASNIANATYGKMIQVGDWLFHLGSFAGIDYATDSRNYLARMPRFKIEEPGAGAGPVTYQLIGVPNLDRVDQHPSDNTHPSSLGNNWVNLGPNLSIGITLVSDTENLSSAQTLHVDSIESNGVIIVNNYVQAINTGEVPRLRIWTKHNLTFVNLKHRLGIYTRKQDQSLYYFNGYTIRVDGIPLVYDAVYDAYYFDVVIDVPEIQDITKTMPVTGTVGPVTGARDIPRASNFGCFYKNRMYYLNAPEQGSSSTTGVRNRMQYSQLTPAGEVETGKYANYIEGEEFVGNAKEGFTGCVEFLGQLVIFKESSVHVLNNDISVGTLRKLFEDEIGCVNINGGCGVLVADEKLYWVANTGVYVYDGSSPPRRISMAIQEDLDAIDRTRYSFATLGYDPRYDLLFVCFPKGYIGDATDLGQTFIYHPKEEGSWTKARNQISSILHRRSIGSFASEDAWNYAKAFVKSNLLEENGHEDLGGTNLRTPQWISSFYTFKSFARLNHIKRVVMRALFPEILGGIAAGLIQDMNIQILDLDGTALHSDQFSFPDTLWISPNVNANKFKIRLYFFGASIEGFFRINGIDIIGHARGRV